MIDSTSTSSEENKKEDKKKGKTTAIQVMDRRQGEIHCGSVRGQFIKAGEPTVRESVDQNSL